MLFIITNYFAIKLGRANAYKDKKKSGDLWKSVGVFLAGVVNGFLFFG